MLQAKKGFTIIEVVIVLAIAGLIFSIVLWALPNLQKNQRDNSRQQIANNLEANLGQYASNSNGSYPASAAEFGAFLQSFYECATLPTSSATLPTTCKLEDPKTSFTWTWSNNSAAGTVAVMTTANLATVPVGSLRTFMNARCSDTTIGSIDGAQGTKAYAVMVRLENGVAYCADNS